ncbi:hypothetical protein M378DRAFT_540865 [Amanita muscaria Koide BX008]|uniref:Uncharacterized protein n=1 Tax=Amanita muscaria (strain Koide BX008) TaxID=946122 RepID=A0A0C2WIZ0_AMAMK|nr:hypothetical protein M378DRAFT_540865 [Amanita muscaria Koide BX008]
MRHICGGGDRLRQTYPSHSYIRASSLQVYELIGSRWVNKGTTLCFGQISEDITKDFSLPELSEIMMKLSCLLLFARKTFIIGSKVRPLFTFLNLIFISATDAVIVWTKLDGVDYALSFQGSTPHCRRFNNRLI